MSTASAAAVVPPGEVTFLRSSAGERSERWRSSPAPSTVARAKRAASSGEQPELLGGLGQALDEVEDIGRSRAGDRGDGVDQRLVVEPDDLADGFEQRR